MKRIDKKMICDYINSLLKDRCYVGLHSIVDSPTTSNPYINLPKKEKAYSILKNGLINSRGGSMNRTVRFFGDLSGATADIKNKMSEYYEGINSRTGENYVVVVAIPYFFDGADGKKYFGGYKNYDSQAQFNEDIECYTDYKFSYLIPSEMILGYYTYDDNEKTVTFFQNPRYYSNLSEEEKIKFAEAIFKNDVARLDINNPKVIAKMEKYLKEHPKASQTYVPCRTMNQYFSLKELELIHSRNTKKDSYREEDFIVQTISTLPIQLEYPDFSIHDVICYRFAKAQFPNGEQAYFIEYKKALDDTGKETDCYAILENINGIFCKSSAKIDYNLLNQNVIREMNLETLPTIVTMKGSKRTEEILIENYKRNEKHLEKKVGGGGADSKPLKQEQQVEGQLQDIYIILPTVTETNESFISINKLAVDFRFYGKFASFSETHEKQDVPAHHENSYSHEYKILNSCELDEKAVQDIISYLNEQSKGEEHFSASRIHELVSGNVRFNFIPASDAQYGLATNQTLKQIYLPSKIGHERVETQEMLQRFMNRTAFGMVKCVSEFGVHYGEIKPLLREIDKEKLNLIISENKLLRTREDYPFVEEIVPYVTDSYELDTAIDLLKKQNNELKKLQPLTLEQLEEKRKREIQVFSDFFSSISADVNVDTLIQNEINNFQTKRSK